MKDRKEFILNAITYLIIFIIAVPGLRILFELMRLSALRGLHAQTASDLLLSACVMTSAFMVYDAFQNSKK